MEMDEHQRIIISDMSLISSDLQEFESQLESSIAKWNKINPKYVQIDFSQELQDLTSVAEKLGFEYDVSYHGNNLETRMVYFTPEMRE